MATKKISELEAINAAEDNDVLVIVDTSESTTNKITKGNLLIGAGHTIEMTLNENYQIVLVLKNAAGTALSTQTIDLPNENAVTNLAYSNGILTVTKQSGATSQINLTGLIEGLVIESDFNTFVTAIKGIIGISTNTYDSTQTYNTGDIVVQSEKIYKANQDNITGTFDSSKWDEISLYEYQKIQDEAIAENYKVINKLNEKLENQQKVINQLPQVTGQGTEVTLQDTIEAQFTKFDVEGHSEQETTEGRNLLEYYNLTERTSNGIKFTPIFKDGLLQYINVNGTATGQADYFISNGYTTENILKGDYTNNDTLKILGTGTSDIKIYANKASILYGEKLKDISNAIDNPLKWFLYRIESGVTINNVKIYPFVYNYTKLGDVDYEPYTNGASPSPNWEQPIYSAGDNENLFDIETSTAYQLCTKSDDVFTTSAMTRFAVPKIKLGVPLTVINGTDYYISYDVKTNSGDAKKLNYYGRLSEDAGLNITTNFGELIGTFTMSNSYQRVLWKTTATSDFTANYLFLQATSEITNAQTISIKNIKISEVNTKPYSPYGMGSINEKIQTRNFIGLNNLEQGTFNGNGEKTNDVLDLRVRTKNKIFLLSGKYTINVTNMQIVVYRFDFNNILYEADRSQQWKSAPYTFTMTSNGYVNIAFKNSNGTNITPTDVIMALAQLEPGSTATPYVEHKEQDYSIFVQQPMRSIGDVRDLFFKNTVDSPYYDENLTLNGWYEVHLKRMRLTSDINITTDQYGTNSYDILLTDYCKYIANTPVCRSTHFRGIAYEDRATQGNNIIYTNTVGHVLVIRNTEFATIEELKAFFDNNEVYVEYLPETPLYLPCTETQIQQLENKPSTYKDFTTINSEDETPAYLEVSGIRDIDTMFDKVTNAIVSLGGNV